MIFKLTGGLGNQMFQYAYGRSWSIKNKKQFIYYYASNFGNTNRQCGIWRFNIKAKKIDGTLPEILRIIEKVVRIKNPHVLCGYWQGEKYFFDYKDEIRNDFRLARPLDKKNLKFLNDIDKCNSVSIHIRRGDYVSDPKTIKIHGSCTLEYYKKAIEKIKKEVKRPVFFVFSDDPKWVRANFKFGSIRYIDWNKGINSYKDMELMSHCKHNIIANSSFSWWGAWLNNNPHKIVIAPKKWFNEIELQKEMKDLIPKKWIKL